jgi:predicted Fe-S protein YdhL (DUF1289 family)
LVVRELPAMPAGLPRPKVDLDATPVPSPCVSICRMNPESGWCEGCGRTIDEIAQWSTMSDDDRRAVWAQLARRLPNA